MRLSRLSSAQIFFLANIFFIGLIFLLGFRSGSWRAPSDEQELARHNGEKIVFIGRVCEEADVSVANRRLTICAGGKALITANLYPAYDYGDFLRVSGQLQAPPLIDGFDYESYLARYDIYSVMYYANIESATGTLTWPQQIYLSLIRFKQSLKSLINSHLPEPEAGLADALLLGYRRSVDREDLDIFARVGLSHMIAISGSHITIMSTMIINFLLAAGLSRRRALWMVGAFLFLYPLITGLAASAVRSAIMGGLAFLAIYYGRASSLIRPLIFSASVMLAFNPLLLREDIGFQLSFLALLGIIYLYPLGEDWTGRFLEKRRWTPRRKSWIKNILDIINLTLVSQTVILPVALINFKQLSLIAPLANVLVLWTFPLLLGSLIIALFLTALIPPLGLLWFWPSYLLLKFIFIISELLAAPSWAAVAVTSFNWYWGAGYYLFLLALLRYLKKNK